MVDETDYSSEVECLECGKPLDEGECKNEECVVNTDKGVEWND
jgi:hypothetical protein